MRVANRDVAELHLARGVELFGARRGAEAAAEFRAALAADPGDEQARMNLASALLLEEDYLAARDELEHLVAQGSRLPRLLPTLGYVQSQLGEVEAGIATLRRALAADPFDAETHRNLLLAMNYSAQLSPAEIFAEHLRFGERHAQPCGAPPPERAWPRRLRIGYVSPDLRSHVVARFFLPILAQHDRRQFEVFCYYTHRLVDDTTRELRALAEHWAECADDSESELAARARADRIDILVDLAGHTGKSRLGAFALRAAPLQLTYLGYPNTTGLRAIEGRITDARADPPGEADALHAERLIRVPGSFLCYRPRRDAPEVARPPSRASGRVTFGCFNNFQKLSAPFLRAAGRILAAVPGARLLLKARPLGLPRIAQELRRRCAEAGIAPERLELRGRAERFSDHLAAYAEVDIALDSFPYNGTTTTCEALWMGVPVIALAGERHAARVGAALLHAAGLEELAARSEDEYVERAARLAADPAGLVALRAGMRERLRRSPLMDEAGFVRELERAYHQAWEAKRAEPAPVLDMEAVTATWNRAHETGAHAQAIEAIGAALGAAGGDAASAARLHYMAGCTLEDAQRPADAAAAYRRALALDPAAAKAQNNLGCLLEAAGDLAQAARCYESALRADPALANARDNLAHARRRLDAEPLRLHVGGKQVMPGWRILNVQPGAGVDFVADCCDLGRFADGSVEEIYASHVLEHLGYAERLPRALAEFHRVLRPGGMLRVSVPDFEVLCRLFLDASLSREERLRILQMVFGSQRDAHDFHHCGLTFEILGAYLRAAGFRAAERVAGFGLFADASALRMRGTPISLNVVARK